ncbi:MAG TPA: hypothetical protein VJ507_00835 [Candidatus Bathyarchaeia archaeon]|nr:hypothetical protein [Candidatus Bathyarchaeia archaeon]
MVQAAVVLKGKGFLCSCGAVSLPVHWALAVIARIRLQLPLGFSPPNKMFTQKREEAWVFEPSRNISG